MKPILIVGTSAPQRQELAAKYFAKDYELVFLSPDINEKGIRSSSPYTLTTRIAEAKMKAILRLVEADEKLKNAVHLRRGSMALTFDQVVVWEGEIREKPVSIEECRFFIKCYSNSNLATVQTTVLYNFSSQKLLSCENDTMTFYRGISDEAVERIVQRGVCMRTSGAFVVEDEDMLASMIKIEPGDIDEIRGLCVRSVHTLLRKLLQPVETDS